MLLKNITEEFFFSRNDTESKVFMYPKKQVEVVGNMMLKRIVAAPGVFFLLVSASRKLFSDERHRNKTA